MTFLNCLRFDRPLHSLQMYRELTRSRLDLFEMTQDKLPPQVRISKIADRYLVFSADDVAVLRRCHNLCSVLVGSTPQNPTQNIFLSLPLELIPEEAAVLLDKKAAILVDEASYHLDALRDRSGTARQAYLEQLIHRRSQAKRLLMEDQAQRAAHSREIAKKAKMKKAKKRQEVSEDELTVDGPEHEARVESDEQGAPSQDGPRNEFFEQEAMSKRLAVTATTSSGLNPPYSKGACEYLAKSSLASPLHRHLWMTGYYTTPGLRFGAKYSVYPGDPLRYHAHFLANGFQWDEKIPMLDIVGSGRLGTSVKKGFLIGGEAPTGSLDQGYKPVRAFTIEWAGM